MTIGEGTRGSYENIGHDESTRILLENNNELIAENSELKTANDKLNKWIYRLQRKVIPQNAPNFHKKEFSISANEEIKLKNIQINNMESTLREYIDKIAELEVENDNLKIKLYNKNPANIKIENLIIKHLKDNKYSFIYDISEVIHLSFPSALKYIKIAQMCDKNIKLMRIITPQNRPKRLYYYAPFEKEVKIIFEVKEVK